MGSVTALPPTKKQLDALWERHRALTGALIANGKLLVDRAHMEEAIRARKAFEDAYRRSVEAELSKD